MTAYVLCGPVCTGFLFPQLRNYRFTFILRGQKLLVPKDRPVFLDDDDDDVIPNNRTEHFWRIIILNNLYFNSYSSGGGERGKKRICKVTDVDVWAKACRAFLSFAMANQSCMAHHPNRYWWEEEGCDCPPAPVPCCWLTVKAFGQEPFVSWLRGPWDSVTCTRETNGDGSCVHMLSSITK